MSGNRLTIRDLKEVSELLWPIRAKFHRLGVVLGVDTGTLEVLAKYSDNEGLTEVIIVWLKMVNPAPTWKSLVAALRYDSVAERTLANKIAGKHCSSEVEAENRIEADSNENVNSSGGPNVTDSGNRKSSPDPHAKTAVWKKGPNITETTLTHETNGGNRRPSPDTQPHVAVWKKYCLWLVLVLSGAGLSITLAKVFGGPPQPVDQTQELKLNTDHPVLNKRPTMPELRYLKLPGPDDEAIDIAVRIGTSYLKVGSILLDDKYGTLVENIFQNKLKEVVPTNMEILKKWLAGSGIRPGKAVNTLLRIKKT